MKSELAKAARIKAQQLWDGKWHRIRNKGYHECCVCHAIHRVDYKVEDGIFWEKWKLLGRRKT